MHLPSAARLRTPEPVVPMTTVGLGSGSAQVGSSDSGTTLNVVRPVAETLPAASVARYVTVCSPAESISTGSAYSRQEPPSRAYSTDSMPEPSSVAEIVTVAEPT